MSQQFWFSWHQTVSCINRWRKSLFYRLENWAIYHLVLSCIRNGLILRTNAEKLVFDLRAVSLLYFVFFSFLFSIYLDSDTCDYNPVCMCIILGSSPSGRCCKYIFLLWGLFSFFCESSYSPFFPSLLLFLIIALIWMGFDFFLLKISTVIIFVRATHTVHCTLHRIWLLWSMKWPHSKRFLLHR